jgi:hypothetical protein
MRLEPGKGRASKLRVSGLLQQHGGVLFGQPQNMVRQVSLPDIAELADLWGDLPDDYALDLEPLKDISMGVLPGLSSQVSLGLRQGSFARLVAHHPPTPPPARCS